ncbi:unnamed protein product [Allacma fusca]|uniref:Uncharacterized protein n=1 Tax=Allacma fusca TaxID=39272 RepID=A0A8J2KMU5_9HEXA|nr:unnamed protein product [Allacma fusca]
MVVKSILSQILYSKYIFHTPENFSRKDVELFCVVPFGFTLSRFYIYNGTEPSQFCCLCGPLTLDYGESKNNYCSFDLISIWTSACS